MVKYLCLCVLSILLSGCTLELSITGLNSLSTSITPPQINFKIVDNIDSGETVPVEITGGVPPYQYSITGPATLDLTTKQLITTPSQTPTTATLIITDAVGQTITQTIPIRSAQVTYQAADIPEPSADFTTKDIAFTPLGAILFASSSVQYGAWRIDKLNAAMTSNIENLDHYTNDRNVANEAALVLAVDEDLLLAAGFNDGPSFSSQVTIRRSIDGGKVWSTVHTTTMANYKEPRSLVATSSGNIFIVISSTTEGTTVLKSADQGITWSPVYTGPTDYKAVLRLSEDKNTLYLGLSSGDAAIIKKSTDEGQNWSQVYTYTGPTKPTSIYDIAIKGSLFCWTGRDGNKALSEANMHWLTRCTKDDGVTWSSESFFLVGYTYGNSMAISNSGIIYVVGVKTNAPTLRKSLDDGATWSDVSLPNGFLPEKIEQDPDGHLYLLGNENPSSVRILKSTDNGSTWTEWSHDFVFPSYSYGYGTTTSATGAIFTTGSISNAWLIRKSTDNGTTWTTSDSPVGGYRGTAIKAIGNRIFSIGGTSSSEWTVRKTEDDGATWSSSEAFTCPSGVASATDITGTSSGSIFVVGSCSPSGIMEGVIRRSTDNGGSWQTVDTFQLAASKNTQWESVTILPTGEILALGSGTDASDKTYWVIRKSSDNGQNWITVDSTVEYSPAQFWGFLKIVSNADRIIVGGRAIIGGVPQLLLRQSIDQGTTWNDLYTKSSEPDWKTPDLSTLYLNEDSLYIVYHKESTSGGAFPVTIEKTRNFTDWYKIGEIPRGAILGMSPCGSALCAVGYTGSLFGTDIWADFKIE